MTLIDVQHNRTTLALTLTSEFAAGPERVWRLWSDLRQLERWWGPPSFPATVTLHDLRRGGHVQYSMSGPKGEQPRGYWEVIEVDAPHALVFRDGFANDDGTPNDDMPVMTVWVTIDALGSTRTRMKIDMVFASRDAMEKAMAMGLEEGMKQAVGQIDTILAEPGWAPT